MNHASTLVIAVAAALTGLSGCGTTNTDPRALAYANHTVKLMGEAEKDAKAFRDIMDSAQTARVESMARQKDRMRKVLSAQAVRYRARESAGDTFTTAIREQLMADAEYAAKLDEAPTGPAGSYEATVKALLQSLPNPSPALTEAQAKAAAMGQELSADTRRAETLAFFEAVFKSVQDNRVLIKRAEAEAAAAAKSGDAALTAPTAPKP